MYLEFLKAFVGKIQWDLLCRKYQVDRFILMPHRHEIYNTYTLCYLPAYLEKEKVCSVCLITCDREIYEQIQKGVWPNRYQVQALLKRDNWIHRIIRFYALYEFSNKIKIISLTEPYDTCGENLLGVHGVTKKELLCYDILGLTRVPDEGGLLS